jgi:hypothetical protein
LWQRIDPRIVSSVSEEFAAFILHSEDGGCTFLQILDKHKTMQYHYTKTTFNLAATKTSAPNDDDDDDDEQ